MGSFYVAGIDINGDANHTVNLYIKRKTLEKMAYLFLFDETPDETVLTDLIQEIANLIVGKAKVVAAEKGLNFNISTPTFLSDNAQVSENDLEINFMFDDEIFSIAAKAHA
jgi:CheY-specific phosphatase CheX